MAWGRLTNLSARRANSQRRPVHLSDEFVARFRQARRCARRLSLQSTRGGVAASRQGINEPICGTVFLPHQRIDEVPVCDVRCNLGSEPFTVALDFHGSIAVDALKPGRPGVTRTQPRTAIVVNDPQAGGRAVGRCEDHDFAALRGKHYRAYQGQQEQDNDCADSK